MTSLALKPARQAGELSVTLMTRAPMPPRLTIRPPVPDKFHRSSRAQREQVDRPECSKRRSLEDTGGTRSRLRLEAPLVAPLVVPLGDGVGGGGGRASGSGGW